MERRNWKHDFNNRKCTFQILGMSRSEDRGGDDNSIQFIKIGRVGDKSFKEWRRKIGGGGQKGGWQQYLFFYATGANAT